MLTQLCNLIDARSQWCIISKRIRTWSNHKLVISSFHLLNTAQGYRKKSVQDKPHTWQLHSRREEIASLPGATTWQKTWGVWEEKRARSNYFYFFHKGRTQCLFPSRVLLSHESGTWLVFQADCSIVLMDRNISKISICTTNEAAPEGTP